MRLRARSPCRSRGASAAASSDRLVFSAPAASSSFQRPSSAPAASSGRRVYLPGADSDSDEGVTQRQAGIKRVRFGNVDPCDDDFGAAPARRRDARVMGRGRGCDKSVVTEAMSDEFGKLVDPLTCRAKIWIDRRNVAHPEWLGVCLVLIV